MEERSLDKIHKQFQERSRLRCLIIGSVNWWPLPYVAFIPGASLVIGRKLLTTLNSNPRWWNDRASYFWVQAVILLSPLALQSTRRTTLAGMAQCSCVILRVVILAITGRQMRSLTHIQLRDISIIVAVSAGPRHSHCHCYRWLAMHSTNISRLAAVIGLRRFVSETIDGA
ncbi:hypothetical protein B0T13DRAFT_35296 [Neurospora crassa]|nr:hypothetical protein B0T13DRAFT_35296 [Neurospora crassa]